MGLYNKHYRDFISFLKDKQSKYVLNMIEIVSDYIAEYIVYKSLFSDLIGGIFPNTLPDIVKKTKSDIMHTILTELNIKQSEEKTNDKR